ncbi:MAG: hypothetical protein Q9182_006302 [Xanthomendoza sp. 2 TL-2023]
MAMLIADEAATSGQQLQAFSKGPFNVAMLHSRLITIRSRLAYTPVHALLSEHGGHSIELAPLPDSTLAIQPYQEDDNPDSNDDMMDIPSPEAKMAADISVLLAVSITEDATCDIAEWKQWLVTRAPFDKTQIQVGVEAVFKGHSTLLIISLPIVAWDCLPSNAAYRFIDFVKSGNLNQSSSSLEIDKERQPV